MRAARYAIDRHYLIGGCGIFWISEHFFVARNQANIQSVCLVSYMRSGYGRQYINL